MRFTVLPSKVCDANLTVPGDKSISHRALMLGSICDGRSDISGFLAGDDCLATLRAMRQLGVDIERTTPTGIAVNGVGLHGLTPPSSGLDLGNSGTAMRLMAGLMSGQNFDCTMHGDDSLNSRPMARIVDPLTKMGASIESRDGKPPLAIAGTDQLRGIHYELPVASAQVKSAILLAGLYATGTTSVHEPAVTRDHTERMLRTMGVDVAATGATISVTGKQKLRASDVHVPADLSSAAFIMLAAVLAEKADILIENVGVNPTRTGAIRILQAMGADISLENPRRLGEEPVADIRVRSSTLHGGKIDPGLVSLAIDEFPVLFVAAAAAKGRTEFAGLAELRVKESDRISSMADGLRSLGIQVDETADGAIIQGGNFGGGRVASQGDHRVAMSLAVAASIASDEVVIEDVDAVDTSFPGFAGCLRSIGVEIHASRGDIA